ncbi:CCA-adding enzyme-like [Chlorella sorokiniana]|uniref:CCA-adding enzyme-like n=1 Tax=Chlorella sorokiniana TaxID=3076 RepID=A0A2P6TG81_CHLSO|nr:CCA-adding enzyme-like [Chlorella sorokiniana]|eukprot:PRW33128.1 CCA-adding enzyme-like [Chlorella sorokiniana]
MAGHEVYVVGGTVRDLLLGGTPKDFDILTSAEPHQIKRLFSRCIIVGRAFPVCQVFTEGTMIEVTSFSTQADTRLIPVDASVHMIGRQKSKDAKWRREGATWAEARSSNASRRDFTVNGLLYEPFSRLLFDSVGGLEDCQARRLRTICPPAESFATDPARILRGVRLAARASLELDPATAAAMEDNAAAIGQLPQGRLQMELTSLLGYGASERSLLLMWRLGLLDMLLPQHALYLRRHKVPRAPRSRSRSRRPELLFELAAELDKHVHPQRPVDPCVWVALLAAPLVVDRISELWKQAHQGRAHAAKAEQQAAEGDAATTAASASTGAMQLGGGMDEGSSGGSEAEDGSASNGGSGSTGGSSGSDGEGDTGLLPDGQSRQQPESHEEAWRREFVDPYQQIVWEVLDSMLLPLDAGTMQQLGRQAKKHSAQLRQGVGSKRRRRGGGGAADGAAPSSTPERPLLPSVLTRPSIERAASLLLMEAELRGRPELQALLERSGWPGKVSQPFRHNSESGDSGSHPHALQSEQQEQRQEEQQAEGEQSQPQHGRHSLHQTLWQRLERAAGGSGNSSGGGTGGSAHGQPAGSSEEQGGAAADAQAEAEGELVPESLPRKLRKRRALSPEERLVLGILSDPRFDYRGRTSLPRAAPEHGTK